MSFLNPGALGYAKNCQSFCCAHFPVAWERIYTNIVPTNQPAATVPDSSCSTSFIHTTYSLQIPSPPLSSADEKSNTLSSAILSSPSMTVFSGHRTDKAAITATPQDPTNSIEFKAFCPLSTRFSSEKFQENHTSLLEAGPAATTTRNLPVSPSADTARSDSVATTSQRNPAISMVSLSSPLRTSTALTSSIPSYLFITQQNVNQHQPSPSFKICADEGKQVPSTVSSLANRPSVLLAGSITESSSWKIGDILSHQSLPEYNEAHIPVGQYDMNFLDHNTPLLSYHTSYGYHEPSGVKVSLPYPQDSERDLN
ncbi:unnamed protein product [Protopolystoma xenopodis]|uniref:Uncharacterized protein n=1 Tax=Protopolystoma xenopodis TaxID=117903 RepID=A0A448WQ83_9PLAT|nr:unnamed protein product [Protopolystoma xenopodis]